jgi:hypothetical protein
MTIAAARCGGGEGRSKVGGVDDRGPVKVSESAADDALVIICLTKSARTEQNWTSGWGTEGISEITQRWLAGRPRRHTVRISLLRWTEKGPPSHGSMPPTPSAAGPVEEMPAQVDFAKKARSWPIIGAFIFLVLGRAPSFRDSNTYATDACFLVAACLLSCIVGALLGVVCLMGVNHYLKANDPQHIGH